MEKFKKVLKLQIKVLMLIGLGAIVIGTAIYEINKSSYKEISKDEFTKIALENKISDFVVLGSRFEMETHSGEKYYHDFGVYSEEEEFEDLILNALQSYGYRVGLSFYEFGIPIIIGIIIGILLINVVIVLWFAAFFNLLKSEFKENHNKWMWFVSFIILPLITPLFYLMISEDQKRID